MEAVILGHRLVFTTAESLFSPRRVDRGTLAMLALAGLRHDDLLLDLGCGYGAVGLTAAKILESSRVVMVDADPLAVMLARQNAATNGLSGLTILESDGFAAIRGRTFTVILCNPPYHSDFSVPRRFIEDAFAHLVPGGRCLFVVQRRLWYERKLRAVFGGVRVFPSGPYYVMTAEKRSATRPPKPKVKPPTRKHAKKLALHTRHQNRETTDITD